MTKKRIEREIENLSTANINEFDKGLARILKKYDGVISRQKLINKLTNAQKSLGSTLNDEQKKLLDNYTKQLKLGRSIVDLDEKRNNLRKQFKEGLFSDLKSALTFFNSVDASIKTSSLNLGLSRTLSDQYRDNLLEASKYAAKLGLSIESLTKAQQAYNTEVGTSVLLSTKSLESVSLIAQGTAMSADEAGTLVGQFKLLGKNASGVKAFVEDTAVESNNMGVNMNKVLKDISSNFSQIQSYNFSNGIKGIQQMALNAAKYKISISDAFAAIDKARTLEGAVEMSAKLMVMGGEFSKQNMFELGFMARNRPDEFIKKMAEMSKGVYFFNKQTGEFQSTAFDLDRLRAVSEATGIPFEKLSESARRLAEINLAKVQLGALDEKDKEMIANMAEMKDGKFTITLGREVVDIRKLGENQIKALKLQNDSLEQRAKDALTFDQELSTMIAEFKTTFLPALSYMNDFLRGIQKTFGEGSRFIVGGLAVLLTAQLPKLIIKSIVDGVAKSLVTKTATEALTGAGDTGGPMGKAGGAMGNFGKMAGGAVAVGGAFLAASYGISMIADSFKQLNSEQLDAITTSIITMGIAIPLSIYAISTAAVIGAKPLGALALVIGAVGLSILGIGAGINLATTGISNLLTNLTAETILKGLGAIAIGLTGIGLSLMTFNSPLAISGILGLTGLLVTLKLFSGTLNNLTQLSTSMANGTEGFKEFGNAISKVSQLTNNDKSIKELRQLINDLNNTKISNPINELKEILSKPLKVEFDSQNVSMVVNLTSQIDGEKLASAVYPHLVKLGINKGNNK
jgi:hypothetical protein